jgi:MerR family copper efflux transcriptional regulator
MNMPGRSRTKPELSDARAQGLLNIGEAARDSGVTAKSIRHYESIGLIPPANRTFANYRLYTRNDVETLRFIRHARNVGFSLDNIQSLLALWHDRNRSSADVKSMTLSHIRALDGKIRELQSMRDTLQKLASSCKGNNRPECPILQELAGED